MSPSDTRRRRRSSKGALTILAMFALGGAVLWGLYHSPRATSPRAPDVPWGVATRTLRIASVDCGWPADGVGGAGLAPEEILPELRRRDADFVFLQGVRSDDVLAYTEGLGMQRSFHPRLYEALGPRPRGPVGCLILSKHPLYDAAPLRPEGGAGACFGVIATAVVDGVRFRVATGRVTKGWEEALERDAKAAGSAPMMFAFDSVEVGLNAAPWWTVKGGGGVEARGAAHGLWAELAPAKDPEHKR